MATTPIVTTRGAGGGSGMFEGIAVAVATIPPPTHVLLIAEESGRHVLALLDAPPQPLGGGGIEPVQRPQRRPVTAYRNPDAPGVALSLWLDGWPNDPVEDDCRTVEQMAGQFVAGDPGPEKLIVAGRAVPHCSGTEWLRRRWIISDAPDWGSSTDEVVRDASGRRLRQHVNLTLLLVTEQAELERLRPRQPKPNYTVAVAQKGDTYEKIAARRLGSKRLGRKLAQLNDDRDPTKTIREGHKVRLPSAHLLAEWRQALGG